MKCKVWPVSLPCSEEVQVFFLDLSEGLFQFTDIILEILELDFLDCSSDKRLILFNIFAKSPYLPDDDAVNH